MLMESFEEVAEQLARINPKELARLTTSPELVSLTQAKAKAMLYL